MLTINKILIVLLFTVFTVFGATSGQMELEQTNNKLPIYKNLTLNSPSAASTYNFSNCILLRMKVYFKTAENKIVTFEGGKVNQFQSYCEVSSMGSGLKIEFDQGYIVFLILEDDHKYKVLLISGSYRTSEDEFFFASQPNFYFETTLPGHHYECNSEQSVPMREGGQLFLSDFAYEVSKNLTSSKFSKPAEVCPLDKSVHNWHVFSLITLLALAALLTILVLYLIKRHNLVHFIRNNNPK